MKVGYCLPGAMLLIPSAVAAAQSADQSQSADQRATQSVPVAVVPDRPPGGTPTRLLVPIVRSGRVLGDLLADLYVDGQIRYERVTLLARLSPLLSQEGQLRFAAALGDATMLAPADVVQAGVVLRYDPSLLEVYVETIDPQLAEVESLGAPISEEAIPITMEPSGFSGYLNVIGDFSYDAVDDSVSRGLLLTGAVRHRGVVFEFDGGIDRQIASGSGIYRRFARLVYDQPRQMRRWTAGDVQVSTLGLLGGVFLGGVGLEKGRRVFNDLEPLTSTGSQQILLDRDATVDVIVGGQRVETLQLRAGPYDLAQLRAQYSGRDAQLFITDITGRRQVASFDTFLVPGSLAPGETEYSAAVGFVPDGFGNQPTYSGRPAFSGYYRRGISNRLTVGGAIQLSEEAQVAGIEMIASPRGIPGVFELGAAVSMGEGFGIAGRVGYSVRFGNDSAGRQFSIAAEYRNANFVNLADAIFAGRAKVINLTANYSQRLSERTSIIVGASWFERGDSRVNRAVYSEVVHSTRKFRLTFGVEYGDDLFSRRFGIRAAISIPFGGSTRADANYNSRRDDFRALVSRSYEDRVGSWGYDVGVRRSQGVSSIDASGTYVGNRFFARGFVSSSGRGLGDIDDNPVARVQIGTALAFADGAVAIGRPITDGFVIASPHEDLRGQQVVLGSSVNRAGADAVSGALGPALSGRLSSYNRQTIVYDLAGDGAGIDIGTGVDTVLPPYRSGYRLTVGTGATVTAFGFLTLPTGRAALISGTVTSVDDPDFEAQPFFTNSTGRFVIIGLKPGHIYEIRLFEPAASHRIEVPADSDRLLQLNEITIIPPGREQE